MEKSYEKKKKNSYQFRTKTPLGLIDQEFWPESNMRIFALKLVDHIYRGPTNKWKILLEKKTKKNKKTRINFVRKRPWV